MLKGSAGVLATFAATKLGLSEDVARADHQGAGGSLSFDGVRQLVRIPDHTSLRLRAAFTLEAWLYPTSPLTTPYVNVAGKLNYLLTLYPAPNGQLVFTCECSTSWGSWHSVSAGPYPLNTWYHLAGVYDGNQLRLFVDGQLVANTPVTGLVDPTSNPFGIGSAEEHQDYFGGLIDEVRVSRVARYTSSFARPTAAFVTDGETVGLWHLDEGQGSQAQDASGNGHHGTLISGPVWSHLTPFGAIDATPPQLSNVATGTVTSSSLTVTWATNEPASSQLEYGPTTSYGSLSPLSSTLVTAHSLTLTGLTADTLYHLRALSRDGAGNLGSSADVSAQTLPASSDTTPPVISALAVGSVTASTATVSWTTDEPASSQAEYGLTSGYGTQSPLSGALVTAHSVSLSGLTADTLYHVRAHSRDSAGNLATSADLTFQTEAVVGDDPAVVGAWGPSMSWPLVAVHMALQATGEVLVFDAWETPGTPSARLWNPATQTFVPVPNFAAELFCSGHAQAGDGRMVFVGGHAGPSVGIRDAFLFDAQDESWTRLADMHYARWYPTATTLGDGRIVVLGGEIADGVFADVPEIYAPAADAWELLPDAELFVDEYPLITLLPNGLLFMVAGPDQVSRTLDVVSQTWTTVAQTPVPDGWSVMYRPWQVMACGGTASGSTYLRTTAVIDIQSAGPSWRTTAPMAHPRFYHNVVLLADGNVLAVGGATTANLIATTGSLPCELWDPDSEAWTEVAPISNPRMYHSTALLLPDGRVLSAGGGRLAPAVDYLTAQIYSPPYLFRGPRPTIASAPGSTTYGDAITIGTPDASAISVVCLIRLGSTTHSVDMDQRYVPLTFSAGPDSLTAQIPNNPNLLPPGNYMLFIRNQDDVPSVSRMLFVGGQPAADSEPPSVAITAPADGAAVSGTGVAVTADASDNVGVASVEFLLDGNPLAAPLTSAPYQVTWDTTGAPDGTHALTAVARDAAGNATTSAPVTVTVTNADTEPPEINDLAAGTVTSTTIAVSWSTNEPASSQLEYGPTASYGSLSPLSSALVTAHSLTLTGLTPDTLYHLRALSRDGAGNLATSADLTVQTEPDSADTTPPVISGVTVSAVTASTATVSWTTDEPASSQAEYGLTVDYGTQSPLSGALVTAHSVGLSGLTAETQYHLRVHSRDAAGNLATSADLTFQTEAVVTPPAGTSLSFDGVRQLVRIPDHASLRLRSAFTLEAWLYPTSPLTTPYVNVAGKLNYLLTLYPAPNGQLTFTCECSTSWGSWHSVSAGPYPLNTWYHLAGVYDGSQLRLFVDGQLVANTPVTGLVDPTSNPFGIGSAEEHQDYFGGLIDEVRVSRVARYTSSFARPTGPFVADGETVGLWHLDEGQGSQAQDASGNGHHGTLINGPVWSQDIPV